MQGIIKSIRNWVAFNRSEGELKGSQVQASTSVHERLEDRRVYPRVIIPFWKYVKIRHNGQEYIGYVKNISKGGFFVETDQIYELHTELEFEFHLPESNERILGKAKVCWARKNWGNAEEPPGMGIEFTQFDGDSKTSLNNYISKEVLNS